MALMPVERLDILVLVDNVTDALSSAPRFVTCEWQRLQQQGMRLVAGGPSAAQPLPCGDPSRPPHGEPACRWPGQ